MQYLHYQQHLQSQLKLQNHKAELKVVTSCILAGPKLWVPAIMLYAGLGDSK
jgi:hypothetical protein